MEIQKEDSVLVSICCITYNQAAFIRSCLDGFIMQKTNFNFEILIHDDASTDDTQSIIREYEEKYPRLIKPIYQTENRYSKGERISVKYNYPRVKGKYIAFCEGDDYWIDSDKLQKQVDYLENHTEASLVFSNCYVENEKNERSLYFSPNKQVYTKSDLLEGFMPHINTILFRNHPDMIPFLKGTPKFPGDRYLNYFCSTIGELHYLNDITAVYRQNGSGVWSSLDIEKRKRIHFEVMETMNRLYAGNDRAYNLWYVKFGIELQYGIRYKKNRIRFLSYGYKKMGAKELAIAMFNRRIDRLKRKFHNQKRK